MSGQGQFDAIVGGLEQDGFAVADSFLPSALVRDMADMLHSRHEQGWLAQARTGKLRAADGSVRGDSIEWLDDNSDDDSVHACLTLFEELRVALNRGLFLNLHDVESHLALYPPGAIYERHLDRFATGDQRRTVSMIVYLNEHWLAADGGELRLYFGSSDTADVPYRDISPLGGRLVVFESARFWHEVRPATRDRMSITGWFRTRS